MARKRGRGGLATGYRHKLINKYSDSMIGYWPMNDRGSLVQDYSTQGNNGAYTAVSQVDDFGPMGKKVAKFDGSTSYNSVYSTGLVADFSGAAGTFAIWAKVASLSVWSDSTARYITHLRADTNNYIWLRRQTTDNQIAAAFDGGGTADSVSHTFTTPPTDWFHLAFTWTDAGDEVKLYVNGAQSGSTQTGIGTWAGDLTASRSIIGASVTTPSDVWSGWLSHAAIWTKVLTGVDIEDLAKKR